MRVIACLEIRVLPALRGLFIDARWTFPYDYSATVPACLDGARRGPAGGLLEGLGDRRRRRGVPNRQNVGEPAYLFQNMKRFYPKAA